MTLRCPKCRYDLTGLTKHRCPECGEPFDPAALAQEQPIRRPRWWMSALAVLVCAYAPFATWIPFQSIVEWFMMWPLLPGFLPGFFLHPRGPLEFAVMGVVALLVIAVAMYFARRSWRALIIACTLLTLWTTFNAWGAYAVSRL